MARILINECKQEISSFNPVLSTYDDFTMHHGERMLAYHRTVRNEVGGALSVFDARANLEVVGGYSARGITSSGTISKAAFDRIAREFLEAVREAGPLDGLYFALHGAMASTDVEDCEGYLLEETRKMVGPAMPIAVSLDLHGILTDRILEHSSVLTVFHTNPHVDFYPTGERAARLLLRLMDGEIRPVTVRVPVPALVRGPQCITETGLYGQSVKRAMAFENSATGLSGGLFIGNPFTDVTDLCSNVFLQSNADEAHMVAEAEAIAQEFWQRRTDIQQPLTSLEESVRTAMSLKGRVVLVDAADATSSGASGDSNAILAELIKQSSQRKCLIPIVDAPAVAKAFAAGVGATITVKVGGTLDPRFTPVEITGRVRVLSDGDLRSESFGEAWYAGNTAVLECGPNTLVLTTRPVNLYDRTLFLANGQHPANFEMTVVKSPLCQPQFFEEGAELRIDVDAPGATSANVRGLGHTRAARPLYPLDLEMSYTPKARLFRRT